MLVTHWLEWLINEQKETGPEFHNELIFNYLERILALKKDPQTFAIVQAPGQRLPAGSETGPLGETRTKLIKFLQTSPCGSLALWLCFA